MRNLDDISPQSPEQGFQFPGVFEITAMGRADAGLEVRVPQIIEATGLSVIAGSLRSRLSREGHYISVTLTFACPDRQAHERVHEALRADEAIRWTI